MEYFVHLDVGVAPSGLVFVAVDIPDRLITSLDANSLPANWRSYPAPEALKDIGGAWLHHRRSAALLVPSALIPQERNMLLNVDHAHFGRIRFGPASRHTFPGSRE